MPLLSASLSISESGLTTSATSAIATCNMKLEDCLIQHTASSKSFASSPSIVIKGFLLKFILSNLLSNVIFFSS